MPNRQPLRPKTPKPYPTHRALRLSALIALLGLLPALPSAADDCALLHASLSERHAQSRQDMRTRSGEAFVQKMVDLEDAVFAAMARCPDDARLLTLMAELQLDLGQIPLAGLYGRKAVAADPRGWAAHHVLGVALSMRGEHDLGIEHLRRAAKLAPDNPRVRLNLASALVRAARPGEALPLLESLTHSDCRQTAAAAYFLRGRWLLEQGRLPEARADFNQSHNLGFSVERDILAPPGLAPPHEPGRPTPAR
ncbi:MAG: tetratricopeptide repeat protein [Thiobacillaceae bacterium]